MAFVVKFELEGGTAEFYDAVSERLDFPQKIPDGLMSHCAFTTDTGFCVCEFWSSQQSQQAFWDDRLERAIGETAQELGVRPSDIDIQMSESYMAYARELSPIHA